MIVKVSDASNSHVFELKALTKFNKASDDIDAYGDKKDINISQNQYQKLYLDFRNDPAKSLKQIVASGGIITFEDASGNNISDADMIRKREQSAKANNLKNNNLLELDLLK
ncbi:hypothetical protein [Halpernia frigidisoli]|uniref:Uncharacterized protein n=1 Tax=Halpernia frigidisoli TaxID=1125876 RepID=A0A1I3J051_9FLAO|nr:hypothetical protein [Halpernia frigidisoli]SFI53652.1 hypothetical protein SAMN05443292_2870 [Halpernia frigidisoli]